MSKDSRTFGIDNGYVLVSIFGIAAVAFYVTTLASSIPSARKVEICPELIDPGYERTYWKQICPKVEKSETLTASFHEEPAYPDTLDINQIVSTDPTPE